MSGPEKKRETDDLAKSIISCALEIHRQLGPGFEEDVYGNVTSLELQRNNLSVREQALVNVKFEGVEIGFQKVDMVVEDRVAVELKHAPDIMELFEQQMLTYLRVSGKNEGIIFNFGKEELEFRRMVKN
jgi:GxxExxY protein